MGNACLQTPARSNRSSSNVNTVQHPTFPISADGDSGGRAVSSTEPNSSNCCLRIKYSYIPDQFKTLDQVTDALRESGLESSNLIVGVDFTKSNNCAGRISFNNRSLHDVGGTPNPYEQAISVIGKTLAPFDEDNLIPCFGFGDATTHNLEVFSFHSDHSPCHGFEEALTCYKKIVPNLKLSGPTSYGPIIDAAVDIVESSGGQFHVLVIVADGQVCGQEKKTVQAIVNASSYPLSIILVGVGDGPWGDMKKFDDNIPARNFDNFQFVNFTAIMAKKTSEAEKETAFALAALMEIPFQYKATMEFGLLGNITGKAKRIVPRPPPGFYTQPFSHQPSYKPSPSGAGESQVCTICLTNRKDLVFGCGHTTCAECGARLANCRICRQQIGSRQRLFTG